MSKFICPKDKEHTEFKTSAYVCQDWLVDGEGNFIEIADECTVVYEYPNDGNNWWCATCGTEAVQEDEND